MHHACTITMRETYSITTHPTLISYTVVSRKYASHISPPCIFSAKFCRGIFIPRISAPPPPLPTIYGCYQNLLTTMTDCINNTLPDSNCKVVKCVVFVYLDMKLWAGHRKGGCICERKCRIPRISPPCVLY